MTTYRQLIYTLIICLSLPVYGEESSDKEKAESKPVPEPKSFVSEHSGTFGGKRIKYTVTAGEAHLKDKSGKATASIWSVAYTVAGKARPVTFVFNGGPGSASVWLHMGLFGPKRAIVASGADRDDGAAPYPVVENPHSLLDITDLVFIDPVGTGYSIVVGEGKEEDFWNLNGDTESIARFIRLWITKHKRWNAPKYIAGESFGTTRAVAVAHALMGGGQDVAMNGLILISQALDYTGSTPVHDNLIAYLTYLPTIAATAHYHGKAGAGKSLAGFVEEARQFVSNEYAPALLQGTSLGQEKRDNIADRLSYFTGLDKTYILRANLRVLVPRFTKELLRDKGLTVGRLDGRYMGDEDDDTAATPTIGDASFYGIVSAYTAVLNDYLAGELGVVMDRPYVTGNAEINKKWVWRTEPEGEFWEPSYVNVARRLGDTMRKNTDLKVLVANGYYDLITPFFDAEYTFARHGIVMDRVEMTYYEGGHMMYLHEPDLVRLTKDMRALYGRTP